MSPDAPNPKCPSVPAACQLNQLYCSQYCITNPCGGPTCAPVWDGVSKCSCQNATTAILSLPLLIPGAASADLVELLYSQSTYNSLDHSTLGALQNPFQEMADALQNNDNFMAGLTNFAQTRVAAVSCLETSDISIVVAKETGLSGQATIQMQVTFLQGSLSTDETTFAAAFNAAWNDGLLTAADIAMCAMPFGTTTLVALLSSFTPQLGAIAIKGQTLSIGLPAGSTCDAGSTKNDCACDVTGTNCVYNFSSCSAGGPRFFSGHATSAFLSLYDEQGRVFSVKTLGTAANRNPDSYLGLSPAYLIVAIALVAAVVVGSIAGVVLYRRKQRANDFMAESNDNGWVAGNKASLEGRTRAGSMNQ